MVRLASALLLASSAASGQDQQDQPIVRVSVDLVQIEAVVTDSKGNHVTDLKPEDFEVLDSGKSQKIDRCTYIQMGTANPGPLRRQLPRNNPAAAPRLPAPELALEQVRRTIVFLVDDDSFAPQVVPAVRKAMRTVIEQKVEPGDLVAVIRTMSGTGALDQFTSNRDLLLASVERIRWHPGGRGNVNSLSAGVSLQKTRSTLHFVISALGNLPGKKAIIFISQSWLGDGKYSIMSERWRMPIATGTGMFVDEAIRSGVTIYTIDPTALDSLEPGADYDITQDYINKYGPGNPNGIDPATANQLLQGYRANAMNLLELKRAGLKALADGTGGLMIADTNDPAWGMSRFLDDLQGHYRIEFKPSDPDRFFGVKKGDPPPFHRLKIRLKRKGLHVRSYAGFRAQREPAEPVAAHGDAFERALSSPFAASAIPLRLTAIFNARNSDAPEVDILLHIDAQTIRFAAGTDGRENGALELVARMVDENGTPAESVKKDISIHFTDAQFKEAQRMGLLYQASIPVSHPGYYEARIAVRDGSTGNMGSARQYVDVPDLKKGQLAMSGLLVFGSGPHSTDPGAMGVAALRAFNHADTLNYVCQIFNAKPAVETSARVFHDGKPVSVTPSASRVVNGAQALTAAGTIPLSSLDAGDYVLQLVVSGEAGKTLASQWTDFEIVR